MPTNLRQRLVKAGYAPKHHGHDPKAEKLVAAEEKANQKRQAEYAGVKVEPRKK